MAFQSFLGDFRGRRTTKNYETNNSRRVIFAITSCQRVSERPETLPTEMPGDLILTLIR